MKPHHRNSNQINSRSNPFDYRALEPRQLLAGMSPGMSASMQFVQTASTDAPIVNVCGIGLSSTQSVSDTTPAAQMNGFIDCPQERWDFSDTHSDNPLLTKSSLAVERWISVSEGWANVCTGWPAPLNQSDTTPETPVVTETSPQPSLVSDTTSPTVSDTPLLIFDPATFDSGDSDNNDSDFASLFEGSEVHWIGLYEQGTISEEAVIVVDRPGEVVSLILTSYDSINWKIEVTEGTKLQTVWMASYHESTITGAGIGGSVDLINSYYDSDQGQVGPAIRGTHTMDGSRFFETVQVLFDSAKIQLSSFQGQYQFTESIRVDAISDDPRIRVDYPNLLSASEIPDHEFGGIVMTPAGSYGQHIEFVDFTFMGPDGDSERTTLPSHWNEAVYNPQTNTFFGITNHGLFEFDPLTGESHEILMTPGLESMSWVSALTYDSSNERIIVATTGGGGHGYLYAFHPENGEWNVISALDRSHDVVGLAYDAATETIWGLRSVYYGNADLVRFDSDGQIIATIALEQGFLPDHLQYPLNQTQMIFTDGKLALIVQGNPFQAGEYSYRDSYLYLIDPVDGGVDITWKSGTVYNEGSLSFEPSGGGDSETNNKDQADSGQSINNEDPANSNRIELASPLPGNIAISESIASSGTGTLGSVSAGPGRNAITRAIGDLPIFVAVGVQDFGIFPGYELGLHDKGSQFGSHHLNARSKRDLSASEPIKNPPLAAEVQTEGPTRSRDSSTTAFEGSSIAKDLKNEMFDDLFSNIDLLLEDEFANS